MLILYYTNPYNNTGGIDVFTNMALARGIFLDYEPFYTTLKIKKHLQDAIRSY